MPRKGGLHLRWTAKPTLLRNNFCGGRFLPPFRPVARTTVYLIEILLPLTDNSGQPFRKRKFAEVRGTLIKKFGGLTAFTRAPAKGLFREGEETIRDDIAVFEVMTDDLDRAWWEQYRKRLEHDFVQEEIVVRCSTVTRL
jgi:hypothetical protein